MPIIAPTHPGAILREDFLKPMGLSAYRLVKEIGVPTNRITTIVKEQRDISVETALLLAHFFGTSEMLWVNLQKRYQVELAKDRMQDQLRHIRRYQQSHHTDVRPSV